VSPDETGGDEPPRDDATTSLQGLSRGDRAARDKLFQLLHSSLRAKAAAFLQGERPGHTLQATGLVNEAWLRMIDQDKVDVKSKGHFMALAAQAMHRILVDHARRRGRGKRVDGHQREPLDENLIADETGQSLDLLAVDEALDRLRGRSERLAALVEMRFFGQMTIDQVAEVQGVDRATIVRDWRVAKALLSSFLKEPEHG
jgi:RNA polymerase sigma factor (TIGR02999 family)